MPGVAFLHGERVTLHTIERDDATFLQRGRNHPAVRGPIGLANPTNAEQVEETIEEWVETDDSINLLVCRNSDSEESAAHADLTPMGAVNVWELDRTRPKLAYWLLPEYHGEGYATEAVTLLLDHIFDAHEVRGVEARVFSHNDASQALLDRLGFTDEGRLRENRFVEGAYRDELVFGLLRGEWVGDS